MNGLPVSILYSQNRELYQRLRGYLHGRCDFDCVTDPSELKLLLKQRSSLLLFADLRSTDCASELPTLRRDFPETVIVALGDARSDQGLMARDAGIYGIEPADSDRPKIQALFDQAQLHIQLQNENRMLKEELRQQGTAALPQREARDNINPSLYHFSGALRRFDNIGIMLESIVEGVAGCARVSRVAVFSVTASGLFRYRAGVRCMDRTRDLVFKSSNPFVQWLQIHAHSISRSMLRHIDTIDDRLLLEKNLDLHGSELILPLFGRKRLIGWLCLGRPSSGVPFEQRDIEDLALLAEQISVAIENSLLHENIAVQKALAENLLQAIPVGIIAAGVDGAVQWFNHGAEQLLNVAANERIDRPVERLDSRIASLLNRCIAGERHVGPIVWTEPLKRRELSIQARRLLQNGQCVGAMAVLKDLTEERLLREKQTNLERAEFWNELAGALSHEVRNPLVAISTFSQLLPERYADEEFRTQFRDITLDEVGRLNTIIDQLDKFAHPPTLHFAPVDVQTLLNATLDKVRTDADSSLNVQVEAAPDLLPLRGDIDVLSNSLVHLLHNARAAVEGESSQRITISARPGEIGAGRQAVIIEVRDNGKGIPDDVTDKVFSPFCTTKARGVGLGLPIVRRTMIDHEGLVEIDSGKQGTTVRLTLPAYDGEKQI